MSGQLPLILLKQMHPADGGNLEHRANGTTRVPPLNAQEQAIGLHRYRP
jgi:hypothetical protein